MLPPSHQQKSYVSLSRMFSPHWAVFVRVLSNLPRSNVRLTQFEAGSNVRLTQFEAGSVTIFCHIPASGVRVQAENKGAGWEKLSVGHLNETRHSVDNDDFDNGDDDDNDDSGDDDDNDDDQVADIF